MQNSHIGQSTQVGYTNETLGINGRKTGDGGPTIALQLFLLLHSVHTYKVHMHWDIQNIVHIHQ